MQGHTGRLNSVRLGPNNTALTVSDDYTARVWDLSTGTCQHVFKGEMAAASHYCSNHSQCTLKCWRCELSTIACDGTCSAGT